MSLIVQDLLSAAVIAVAAVVTWHLRTQAADRHHQRVRQLNEAADFLAMHVRDMALFLEHPAATAHLKALLMRCSAVLEDREAAERLTGWAASRTFEALADAQETRAIDEELSLLRRSEPDLADCFDTAIVAAVAAASLRWPESAARFEAAFPRMMATPRRDAAIVAAVTRLEPGPLFSVRPVGATAAA